MCPSAATSETTDETVGVILQLPDQDSVAFADVFHQWDQAGAVIPSADMVSEKVFVTPTAWRAAFC
jgi:hypothetical protein